MKKIDEYLLEDDDEVVLAEDDETLLSGGDEPTLETEAWATSRPGRDAVHRPRPPDRRPPHPRPAARHPGSMAAEPIPDRAMGQPGSRPDHALREALWSPPGTAHKPTQASVEATHPRTPASAPPRPVARPRPRRHGLGSAALVATTVALLWLGQGPGEDAPLPSTPGPAGEPSPSPPAAHAPSRIAASPSGAGGGPPAAAAGGTPSAERAIPPQGPLAPGAGLPASAGGPQIALAGQTAPQVAQSPPPAPDLPGPGPVGRHQDLAMPPTAQGDLVPEGVQPPPLTPGPETRYEVTLATVIHRQAASLSPLVDILQPGEGLTVLEHVPGTHWYRVTGASGVSGYADASGHAWSRALPTPPSAAGPSASPRDKTDGGLGSIAQLLRRAGTHLRADRLTAPRFENALSLYREVLRLDSDNPQALAGIDRIKAKLSHYALDAEAHGDVEEAQNLLVRILRVDPADRQARARLSDLRGRAESHVSSDRTGGTAGLPASGRVTQKPRRSGYNAGLDLQ